VLQVLWCLSSSIDVFVWALLTAYYAHGLRVSKAVMAALCMLSTQFIVGVEGLIAQGSLQEHEAQNMKLAET
jgi:hypothetical protein